MANKKPPQKIVEASYSYEGGDSFNKTCELLFIYLSFMIQEKCVLSVSQFKKTYKDYEGFLSEI